MTLRSLSDLRLMREWVYVGSRGMFPFRYVLLILRKLLAS